MAQGGDPTGTGMGGSKLPDLPAEFSAEPHVRGVCSMARAQNPNSANSQFFICFEDARFLDNQYTVWGEVIDGMDHVDALPKGEPPREPGKIVTATVGRSEERRVGKECVSTCRSLWWPYHEQKQRNKYRDSMWTQVYIQNQLEKKKH